MSLFDDVIVNAAAAVDTVGKIASDVVDGAKVRVSSAELRNKINAQFETLGRYVYDTTVAGTTDENIVKEYVANISVLLSELKSLQDSLSSDGGRIICPKCCCKNSVDSLFCKKCGSSLDFAHSYTSKAAQVPFEDVKEAAPEQVAEDKPAEEPAEEAAATAEENTASEE